MQAYRRVGDWMVTRGIMTEAQLDQALEMRPKFQLRFGEFLVTQGYCTESDITECLAEQFSMPIADLEGLKPKVKARQLVSGSFALNRLVLPIELKDGTLTCVIGDPIDIHTTDELRNRTGFPLNLILAPVSPLREAIRTAYRLPSTVTAASQAPVHIDQQDDRRALIRALQDGGLAA